MSKLQPGIISVFLVVALTLSSCDVHDTRRSMDGRPSVDPVSPYYGLIGQAFSDKHDGMLTELYDVLEFDPDLREQSDKTAEFASIEEERRHWHGTRRDYEESFDEAHKRWGVSYVRDVERSGFRKQSETNLTYQFRTAAGDTIKDPYARNVYRAVIEGRRQGVVNDRDFDREIDMQVRGLNERTYEIRGSHTSTGVRSERGRPGSEFEERYEIRFSARDAYINTRIPENLLYQIEGQWNVTLKVDSDRSDTRREFSGTLDVDGNGYAYLRMARGPTVRFDFLTGRRG